MLDLSKDEKAKAGWLRPRRRAVDRAAVRPFSANGSDAVLREFAVARHDRIHKGVSPCGAANFVGTHHACRLPMVCAPSMFCT